jgi:hypothetical protein
MVAGHDLSMTYGMRMCMRVYVYVFVHVYVCFSVNLSVCVCVCVCACVRTGRHETYLIHVESVRTKGPPRQVRGFPLYSNDKRTGEKKQTRGQDNKSRKRDNSNSTHITRGTNQGKGTREEENEEQIIRGI